MSVRWTYSVLVGAGAILGIAALVARHRQSNPPSQGGGAPFSVTNTLSYLDAIESSGPRVPGTRAYETTADTLVRILKGSSALEVTSDDVTGMQAVSDNYPNPVAYRVRTVTARLRGRSPDAMVLTAHYDSAPGSPGAADDGLAVATLLEVALNLSRKPPLALSTIFIFDGAEEYSYAGASAYRQNPYLPTIRGLINLDALGGTGSPAIVRASDDALPLLRAYARVSGHPAGTVLADALLKTGALGSNTNYVYYREITPVPSLDVALIGDGYAYHSGLDSKSRISAESVAELGELLLALVPEISQDVSALKGHANSPLVFYDLFGIWFVAYGHWLAWLVVSIACAIYIHVAIGRLPIENAGRLLLRAIAVVCAAIVCAVAASVAIALGLHRPMTWFAHPARGTLAYASAALLGGRWALGMGRRPSTRFAGQLAITRTAIVGMWLLLSITCAALGLRPGFVFVWWLAPGLAFVASPAALQRRKVCALLALIPGAALSIREWERILQVIVPLTARIVSPLPADALIAVLSVVPALILLLSLAWLDIDIAPPKVTYALTTTAVVAVAVLCLSDPFTRLRPKRVIVEDSIDSVRRVLLRLYEPTGTASLLASGRSWTSPTAAERLEWRGPMYVSEVPSPRSPVPIAYVQTSEPPAAGSRRVTLRIKSNDGVTTFRIPRRDVSAWSWGPLPRRDTSPYVTGFLVGALSQGVELTVTLLRDRVPIRVSHVVFRPSAETQRVVSTFPEWVTAREQQVDVQWLDL